MENTPVQDQKEKISIRMLQMWNRGYHKKILAKITLGQLAGYYLFLFR